MKYKIGDKLKVLNKKECVRYRNIEDADHIVIKDTEHGKYHYEIKDKNGKKLDDCYYCLGDQDLAPYEEEFQLGDMVKIKKCSRNYDPNSTHNGKVGKIYEKSCGMGNCKYHVKVDLWFHCCASEVEPVKLTFKIGDKVRIKECINTPAHTGMTGVVVGPYPLGRFDVKLDTSGREHCFGSELEHYEETTYAYTSNDETIIHHSPRRFGKLSPAYRVEDDFMGLDLKGGVKKMANTFKRLLNPDDALLSDRVFHTDGSIDYQSRDFQEALMTFEGFKKHLVTVCKKNKKEEKEECEC